MRLYSPVDLTGNVNMIEKLVLGGTGTGDLPILIYSFIHANIKVNRVFILAINWTIWTARGATIRWLHCITGLHMFHRWGNSLKPVEEITRNT